VNVQVEGVHPRVLIGGETVALKAKGIFNSVNKMATLKIGTAERLIDLEYVDSSTFTFVAPPLLWIKETRYKNDFIATEEQAESPPEEIEMKENTKEIKDIKNVTHEQVLTREDMTQEEKNELFIKKFKLEVDVHCLQVIKQI